MSFRPPKRAAEGDGRDHPSSEETDTNVDNPLFRATERRPTATFGPAVAHPAIEERTETTVPQLDPTVPITRLATGRRSWTAMLSAVAIGALLGVALVAAYASHQKPAPLPDRPSIEPAVAGGVIEVAPLDPDRGVLVLDLPSPGAASVKIASATWETTWAGTEPTIELRGLLAGPYTMRTTPGSGTPIRDTVQVLAGRTCRYTLTNGHWTPEGCR